MVCMTPTLGGTGVAIQGDVCSAEFFVYGTGFDSCESGVTCVPSTPTSLRQAGDTGGACCNDENIIGRETYGSWVNASTSTQKRDLSYEPCLGQGTYTFTQYRCASGYYGTPTRASGDCKACPANSACDAGSTTIVCSKGYYGSGTSCAQCPGGGTTSTTGAASVTQCCLPSGTTFSDTTGSGVYTAQCCYS